MGAGLLILAGLLWLVAGCQDQIETERPPTSPGEVFRIVMDTDTLVSQHSDMVSSRGYVIAADGMGWLWVNTKIALSLSENFGAIEFADPIRRDTTNSDGRVDFYFRIFESRPVPVHNTITAYFEGRRVEWNMTIMPPSPELAALQAWADPDVVTAGDSTEIIVRLSDNFGNAFAGFDSVWKSDGNLIVLMPPTNALGESRSHWTLPVDPGSYFLVVGAGAFRDSVWAVVVDGQ
jgi:hypothetical protein